MVAIGGADKRSFVNDQDAETHKFKSTGLNPQNPFKDPSPISAYY
jgi:hypothetical protein